MLSSFHAMCALATMMAAASAADVFLLLPNWPSLSSSLLSASSDCKKGNTSGRDVLLQKRGWKYSKEISQNYTVRNANLYVCNRAEYSLI